MTYILFGNEACHAKYAYYLIWLNVLNISDYSSHAYSHQDNLFLWCNGLDVFNSIYKHISLCLLMGFLLTAMYYILWYIIYLLWFINIIYYQMLFYSYVKIGDPSRFW
jgi:hypothetical protein